MQARDAMMVVAVIGAFTAFMGAGLMQVVPGIVLGLWTPVGGHPPEEAYRVVFAGIATVLLVAIVIFTLVFRRTVAEGLRRGANRATSGESD